MMAEKEETTSLIDVTQRGSVKTSVQVPDGLNSMREDSYNQYDLGATDKNDSW